MIWSYALMPAILFAGAAVAQDYTGNVEPSAYSLPTVMHSAINARAPEARAARYRSATAPARALMALPRPNDKGCSRCSAF